MLVYTYRADCGEGGLGRKGGMVKSQQDDGCIHQDTAHDRHVVEAGAGQLDEPTPLKYTASPNTLLIMCMIEEVPCLPTQYS